MRQGHAKTNRPAVILHVKGIARESEHFGELIHDLGNVIERICELFRVRPVAMSEARIIWCDEVILIRKAGEERLEHSRRRRKSVQQEKDRRLFRSGFSIKDGEPIYLDRAIRGRIFHRAFFPFGLDWQFK